MNTRILVILSLLVGIGAVLHAVVPPVIFGVKPDMLLSMMFLGILLFPKVKYVALLAIVTGVISALTTSAPGGQIANLIDKPITALVFLALFLTIGNKVKDSISVPVLTFIGTIISGSIFLSVALFIIGLMEGAFISMFALAVLPAAVLNTVIMVVVYPIVQRILKRSRPITA
ncbi:tryptophan transporter [Virgibacillus profundi]|uniref:Tryptophan transporter n=1 Tax=Virgibacillus profundi TaxID=2024555 RepID=A0A2A2IDE9_9BACI|nr:tryptophan transporter [Virgibacillus profundi]PAV29294.1 tryptophan transporter [Virgibacillus profundi]PXY53463.1 tryptophan transporter [Virgibacillus profundi]